MWLKLCIRNVLFCASLCQRIGADRYCNRELREYIGALLQWNHRKDVFKNMNVRVSTLYGRGLFNGATPEYTRYSAKHIVWKSLILHIYANIDEGTFSFHRLFLAILFINGLTLQVLTCMCLYICVRDLRITTYKSKKKRQVLKETQNL